MASIGLRRGQPLSHSWRGLEVGSLLVNKSVFLVTLMVHLSSNRPKWSGLYASARRQYHTIPPLSCAFAFSLQGIVYQPPEHKVQCDEHYASQRVHLSDVYLDGCPDSDDRSTTAGRLDVFPLCTLRMQSPLRSSGESRTMHHSAASRARNNLRPAIANRGVPARPTGRPDGGDEMSGMRNGSAGSDEWRGHEWSIPENEAQVTIQQHQQRRLIYLAQSTGELVRVRPRSPSGPRLLILGALVHYLAMPSR